MIKALLAHPATRGLDIDDPETTQLRRQIIQQKGFLRRIYQDWYSSLSASLPPGGGVVLELGSGAGFLKEVVLEAVTSEVFYSGSVDVTLDALKLPFANAVLRSIVMIDVLHHLPQPRQFFAEAARCIRPGGAVVLIEPWVTSWSKVIYRRFHHEPFEPNAVRWEFESSGPLSGANGALPWIIFERDRQLFESEFPEWQVRNVHPMMPFRYLVSGGVSQRALMPAFMYTTWRWLENRLDQWRGQLAMFALIELRRMG